MPLRLTVITRVAYDISCWTAFLINLICHYLPQFPHLHKGIICVFERDQKRCGPFAFVLKFEIGVSVLFYFSPFVINFQNFFFCCCCSSSIFPFFDNLTIHHIIRRLFLFGPENILCLGSRVSSTYSKVFISLQQYISKLIKFSVGAFTFEEYFV